MGISLKPVPPPHATMSLQVPGVLKTVPMEQRAPSRLLSTRLPQRCLFSKGSWSFGFWQFCCCFHATLEDLLKTELGLGSLVPRVLPQRGLNPCCPHDTLNLSFLHFLNKSVLSPSLPLFPSASISLSIISLPLYEARHNLLNKLSCIQMTGKVRQILLSKPGKIHEVTKQEGWNWGRTYLQGEQTHTNCSNYFASLCLSIFVNFANLTYTHNMLLFLYSFSIELFIFSVLIINIFNLCES